MPTAQYLAHRYDTYAAARRAAEDFDDWLGAHWRADGPPEPTVPPVAINVMDRGCQTIRWYESAGVVRGYIPGQSPGCYEVPVATVPGVSFTTAKVWATW